MTVALRLLVLLLLAAVTACRTDPAPVDRGEPGDLGAEPSDLDDDPTPHADAFADAATDTDADPDGGDRDTQDEAPGVDHDTASDPGDGSSDAGTPPPASLEVRFLGVGGLSFALAGDRILTAPLYSNPDLTEVIFGEIASDPDLVDRFLDDADLEGTRAILVGHGHYDHLLDVPTIWERTDGAMIYGNVATQRILAGFAPEPDPTCPALDATPSWPLVPPEVVVALNDPANDVVDSRLCRGEASCTGEWSGSAGAWVAVPDSHVRIRALCSSHPDQFIFVHFAEGCVDEPLCEPPRRAEDWLEGSTLAFLIDFLDDDGTPIFRIYYQDAPTDAPIGHVPAAVLAEKRVDLAVLNVGNYDQVRSHPEEIVATLRPRYAIGSHWENFFQPQSEPVEPIPFHASIEAFEQRLGEALGSEAQAPVRVDGHLEERRHWVPDPGTRFAFEADPDAM